MRMSVWIALVGLALAAIALAIRHDAGTVLGLLNEDFARIVALSALAIVIGSGLFWQMRGEPGSAMKMAAIWVAVAGVLVVGYTFRHDAHSVLARVVGELAPGMVVESGGATVAVMRAGDGHFFLSTQVNGASVRMLFDTGASTVVLTTEDARRAGIDPDGLVYSAPVWTANGRTTAAPVTLDVIDVGSISISQVRAVVARPGTLRASLLGMSLLDRLRSWRVERDRLILDG